MDFPTFKKTFNLKGIDLLPHRDPFLFVDELIAGDETGGIGKYTFTDPSTAVPGKAVNAFFEGHFPFFPVVPGVILIEAIVACELLPAGQAAFLLASVDKVRFRKPVRPGDTLVTVAHNLKILSKMCVLSLKGYVGETLVAEAEVKCALGTRDKLGF